MTVIRAAVTTHVRAPAGRVRALYEDVEHWGRVFPATIRGARVVRTEGDATFVVPEGGGTRFTLTAAVRLRWPYRLLAPLLRPLVVARMRRYVVEPLKAAAEGERR